MQKESQLVESSISFDSSWEEGSVQFDSARAVLAGSYNDEISAFRAKKTWADTLELHFLLDESHDFKCKVISDLEAGKFALECQFVTACARYAFWRLTNNQAPEAQYIIETAHIPVCESRHDEILLAPDMQAISLEDASYRISDQADYMSRISRWLKAILKP